VRFGEVDRDFRVLALKVLETRDQPLGAKGRHHRQLDDVRALLSHDGQGVAFHRVQLRGDPTAIRQACFRQLDPTPRASKQLDT